MEVRRGNHEDVTLIVRPVRAKVDTTNFDAGSDTRYPSSYQGIHPGFREHSLRLSHSWIPAFTLGPQNTVGSDGAWERRTVECPVSPMDSKGVAESEGDPLPDRVFHGRVGASRSLVSESIPTSFELGGFLLILTSTVRILRTRSRSRPLPFSPSPLPRPFF